MSRVRPHLLVPSYAEHTHSATPYDDATQPRTAAPFPHRNHSGPLFPETDRGAALNHGSEYVVTVWLAGRDAMLAYGPHPKHVELMELQATKLTPDGKCVLDPLVDGCQ